MKSENVKLSYETLWKFIIRPPRDKYSEDLLGPNTFIYRGRTYKRKDYNLLSSEGYTMKCSFIEPEESFRPKEEMSVVLYLHGNSSSRLEGMRMTEELLKRDINLFLIDFPGCGLSGGEYISLGYHEKDDVGVIIDFIEKIPGVGNIGIWGRSMGAATTILYAHKDPRIKAICVDSPFADFKRLAKELTSNYVSLPNFVLDALLSIVRSTIKKKNGLDINLLKPIEAAEKTFQPGLFIHAKNDELIKYQHSVDLFEIYKGPKIIYYCEKGGHNTRRPDKIIKKVGEFFHKYLNLSIDDYEKEFSNNNLNIEENNNNNINEESNNSNNNNINEHNESDMSAIQNKLIAAQDEYMKSVDQNDKKQLEEMKSCLMKINPNDIKTDDL